MPFCDSNFGMLYFSYNKLVCMVPYLLLIVIELKNNIIARIL